MIDLSFLTEEEQEAIMKVLQRDAELKKAEEDRVRVLEDSIDDTNELKNKTGQWFYEAKSKRHRDKIHGADLIRASIRKKKPQTIAELSQSISERSKKSWVSNVNKDLFVPPELFGVMEEPDREDEEEKTQGQLYRSAPKVDNLAFSESEANIQKAVSSPSKQRRNPFNTTSHDNFDLTPENHISENGSARLHEIPEKDVLPISRKSQKSKNIPTIEFSETNQTSSDALIGPDVHEEKKVPKPKARTVTYKIADPQSDSDSSFSKPAMRNDSINGTGARKGILKRSPSSSSTDSEVLRVSYSIDSQSKPVAPTSPIPEGDVEKNDFGGPSEQFSQNSVDRFKQVRFTSISAPDELPETPDSHNGKEIGEFDLLESDYGKNSVDNSNGMNYLHNEHQSSEYRIPAHPETVDFDSNIAVTVSKEEDGDSELALALQSLPSKVDQDVRANVPSAKQVPSSSVIAVQPLPSNSEFLQDGPPAVFTNLRTPKDVSANGNEVPTNDTFSNNQSMDQLNIRSQTSEFVVDQQPIYAQIKSPRKLDSSDSLQGRESIDETEPSRKTEIILKKTLQPKNDDKRDNSNISHNLQCNRNVRVSDDVTFGNSTHVNERKSSFYVADQQPLDAEIKSPQVSKLNSTDHPQGKPTRAGDLSPKSSSKSDKYIIEFKKAADESISKVLDWFNRDSLPSEARTTPMNATEKVFVEESDPSSKTEARAIVLESPRPHADKLRLKDSHLESQPSSATDRAKPFTLNEGAQWKREQLSFENNVNVGRKSGGNGFHDGPDFENQSFKPTSFPPRIESHSPGTGGEQLLFGKSKSGGGKIHFETEYMQDGIQETNSLTTETVPEPRKKSQDHGNRTSVSFSENFFDEPKQDDNKTQRLNNVKKDTFSSPIKLNVDQEVDSNVLDKGEHQQDNLLYWRRPAILQQKAPIQARDKIQTPATKINNDIEKATEWDITANQSKPTFEGDGITNRIGSGLVKVPHETKDKKEDSLDKELQNEAEISIVKVGKSAWASKASESKTMPYKPTDITSAEPTVLSERMSGKDVHSPRDDDWQRKGVATSESSNYERVNANNSLPGKERSPDFQQKHKFQILSLKDRQRESATDKPSNPEQFQSLRNFWSTDIKSPVKAEVKPSVRSVAPVQDRQSPGFLQVEKSLGRNSQNALPAQDSSVSDFNEKDFQIKEWQRKEWVPSPIDISMPESVQTVAKVDAPSKLKDDCKSSVEKLNKEASKMERKVEIGTVNSDLEIAGMKSPETMPPLNQKTLAKNSPSSQSELGQGLFYDRVRRRSHELQDHQRLQAQSLGVIETVEKTIPPSKNDSAELKASLEKLHNEALNAPSPTRQRTEMGQAVTKSSPIPTQQTLYKEHEVKAPRQEIQEIIEKAAAPPKTDVHEFNAGLQKLLEEASVASPEATSDQGKGSEDDLNPVMADLRRTSSKPKPSKSLEDLSSASSKPAKVDLPREESVRSNEHEEEKGNQQEAFYETIPNSSTMPSYPDNRFSDPEKLKRLSKSVPDFLNDESDDRETDSTSGGSYQLGRHKKTPSSLTNLSGSSGMASLSSVSGSVMSIYSGDFGNVDIKGNIQFSIDYVEQLREFHIFVTECKDLAVADVKKNRSDPYVKSYLLPDKEKMGKRKTTVKKKTLNPAYNEILRYKINKPHLLTQKLNLSVWHNDTFGRNSFLGEVDIHLAAWDWNNKQMNWYPLQPRTPAAGIGLENRGEMTISLKYTSIPSSGKNAASSGEVHIWVKSCSNLPILRGNRINSFVKCTVLPDTSRKSRQKTRNVDKTINPVFNHTMVYDGFRAEDLREACVELTVWDHNRLANHFLGGLRLGLGSGKSYGTPVDWMDSTSYEASLWKRMMNSPDQWVEDTLQLRMLMMAKMAK
ncbi:synaptotagmin-like protein 2 isoform X10 [Ambystoma mexicanum]|uniref:synaptotagmin-like protein 2 isoform X10 n=1 Tax=Ambystoma mexicanum TaxID=8296 RepID=UPI0037E95CC7